MSNARFSILQSRAVEDKRISNSQFRTLAALGMYGDKNGWCFPKLKTLADLLGKSRQAVNRDLLELRDLGYIEIYHQYREDGGLQHNKYRLVFDLPPIQQEIDGCKESVYTPSTPEVDTPSTSEVYTPSTSEVDALTPHINAPFNAPVEVEEPERPNIYRVYEMEMGQLTPMLAQMLDDIDKTYPVGWFEDAVKEAKRSTTKFGLKYVETILQRWKAGGRIEQPKNEEPYKSQIVMVQLPDGSIVEART